MAGQRLAHMYKSSCTEEGIVPYDVTADGVRDPPETGWGQPYGTGWGGVRGVVMRRGVRRLFKHH